jgi:hypothetical protein
MAPYRTAAERTLLGGVDVTDIDLTKPFVVDFSVPSSASFEVKKTALSRARNAFEAFDPVKRRWLIRTELDLVKAGRCVMYVYPIAAPSQLFSEDL